MSRKKGLPVSMRFPEEIIEKIEKIRKSRGSMTTFASVVRELIANGLKKVKA